MENAEKREARLEKEKAAAIKQGENELGVRSKTGLTGGEAIKLKKYRAKGKTLSGDVMMAAVENAIATNEVNAAMGVICATPTAGSSGTLPGALFMLEQRLGLSEDQMIRFLFTAGGLGLIIANHAGIAGATGGCQEEVGSASAMAAAAAVEAAGGSPEQSSQALAIALSNLLGLVCDPIAGLVEIPCVKRNAIGAGNALIAADMALAGCTSMIPAEESRCHRTLRVAHHWIAVEVIGHPAAKHLEEAEILWCEHISQCASCHELFARTSPLHVLVDLDARIVR